MNAESLNFEKLVELEATAKLNHIDIIAVTEVQAQNPDLLKMTGFQEFIKLRPVDHPLGKKGGGVMIFVKDILIHASGLGDCDEIIWISTKPKCLPWPYTNLIICSFCYSPGRSSRRNFHDRLKS